jgi:hypothetical protein
MSAKFDTEDMLDMIKAVMTDGDALNNKITAIEAEKAAASKSLTPGLLPISLTAGYFEQTWNEKILNQKAGIFYGIEDVQSVDGGGAVAKTYKCFVEIVLVDSGQTNDGARRINRYSRAIEELFIAAYKPAVAQGSVKIESVRPMSFKLEIDSSDEVRVGGISISITLV